MKIKIRKKREFPSSPAVKDLLFHCRGPSYPGGGTKIPQAPAAWPKKKQNETNYYFSENHYQLIILSSPFIFFFCEFFPFQSVPFFKVQYKSYQLMESIP